MTNNSSDTTELLLRDEYLIGRYLFFCAEGELLWTQRWVEVHAKCFATFVKKGEAPALVLPLDCITIHDEGDRHFTISIHPSNLSHRETVMEDIPSLLPPCSEEPLSDEVISFTFRCCDRIECAEMLDFFRDALQRLRLIDAAAQVSPSEFEMIEVPVQAWNAINREVSSLKEHLDTMRACHQGEVEALQQQCCSALREAKHKLQAIVQRMEQDRSDALDALGARYEARILQLLEEQEAMRKNMSAADKQLKEDIAALKQKLASITVDREAQLLEQQRLRKIKGLERFLSWRRDNLAWLRHQLCSEQIAKFALALKRAGQILQKIQGAEQFAAEFSHDWPIAGKLIELPAMVLEEDAMLVEVIKSAKTSGGSPRVARTPDVCDPPAVTGATPHPSAFPPEFNTPQRQRILPTSMESPTMSPNVVQGVVTRTPLKGKGVITVFTKVDAMESGG